MLLWRGSSQPLLNAAQGQDQKMTPYCVTTEWPGPIGKYWACMLAHCVCYARAGLCCTVFVPETKRIDLDEAALHSKSMFGHFMDRCGIHQVLFRIKYHKICPRTCASSVHHSLVSGMVAFSATVCAC